MGKDFVIVEHACLVLIIIHFILQNLPNSFQHSFIKNKSADLQDQFEIFEKQLCEQLKFNDHQLYSDYFDKLSSELKNVMKI